jgi:hypothetical protein
MNIKASIPLTSQERRFIQMYGKMLKEGCPGAIVGEDQISGIHFTVKGDSIIVLNRQMKR